MTKKTFPAKRTARIGFVFARGDAVELSTRYGGFVKRLQKQGGLEDIECEYFALEELTYVCQASAAEVRAAGKKFQLGDCDYVYVKSWSKMPDRAAALAHYLRGKGIPFADTLLLGKGVSKLTTHMRLWADGTPVIPSVFGRLSQIAEYIHESDYPQVIKLVTGQKGQNNHLVTSRAMFNSLCSEDAVRDYVMQPFVANDGDFRVQVYGYKARLIMKRKGAGTSHLNNTSAGGTAALVALDECDRDIIKLAEKAARACQLEVCGVDVIRDKVSGDLFIMEVNQGSQIVTGLFAAENMAAFNKFLREKAAVRYVRASSGGHAARLDVVGRYVKTQFIDLDHIELTAKTDTGAYMSSMHAENIHVRGGVLSFGIPMLSGMKMVQTSEFGEVSVRNAHGTTKRYTIKTRLTIHGRTFMTTLNLSDRGELKYPVLLGRRFLRGRFMVNVEIGHIKEHIV